MCSAFPINIQQASGSVIAAIGHEYYAYAQDSWKASNDLTVNLASHGTWKRPTRTISSKVWASLAGIPAAKPPMSILAVLRGSPTPGILAATSPAVRLQNSIILVPAWVSPGRRASGPASCWGLTVLINSLSAADSACTGIATRKRANCKTSAIPPGFKNSFGAGDFGGSPSFANPFTDVSTGQSEVNPFPYAYPAAGTPVELAQLCGAIDQHLSNQLHRPVRLQLQPQYSAGTAVNMVLQLGYVGSLGHKLVRAYEGDPITAAGHAACLANPNCASDGGRLSIDFPQYFTQPAIVPGSAGSGTFGNGIPWFISVGQQHTDGASNYNSFQASLTKGPPMVSTSPSPIPIATRSTTLPG
jgi:hypothetical protein